MPEYTLTRQTAPLETRKRQRAWLRVVRDARQAVREAETLASAEVAVLQERAAAAREEARRELAETGWNDEVIANAFTVMEKAVDAERDHSAPSAGADAPTRTGSLYPLFTVTIDDQPLCVVRARDHLEALRLVEPMTTSRLGITDVDLIAGGVLALPQQTRLSIRAPTTNEASFFDRRAVADAVDAVDVILL